MSALVVDASAIVESLVDNRGLRAQVRKATVDRELHAPEIIDVEVLSALARMERAGSVTAKVATDATWMWTLTPLILHSGRDLVAEVWRTRGSLRISDAFYLALARGMGIPLVTCDGRLARAPHPGVTVTLIS